MVWDSLYRCRFFKSSKWALNPRLPRLPTCSFWARGESTHLGSQNSPKGKISPLEGLPVPLRLWYWYHNFHKWCQYRRKVEPMFTAGSILVESVTQVPAKRTENAVMRSCPGNPGQSLPFRRYAPAGMWVSSVTEWTTGGGPEGQFHPLLAVSSVSRVWEKHLVLPWFWTAPYSRR